jgi:hypothetical protein
MTETPHEIDPSTPLRRTESVLIVLGRLEGLVDGVAKSQARVETAVGSLTVRVSQLEVDVAALTTATSRDNDDRARRTPPVAWLGAAVSAAALLATIVIALLSFNQ